MMINQIMVKFQFLSKIKFIYFYSNTIKNYDTSKFLEYFLKIPVLYKDIICRLYVFYMNQ